MTIPPARCLALDQLRLVLILTGWTAPILVASPWWTAFRCDRRSMRPLAASRPLTSVPARLRLNYLRRILRNASHAGVAELADALA